MEKGKQIIVLIKKIIKKTFLLSISLSKYHLIDKSTSSLNPAAFLNGLVLVVAAKCSCYIPNKPHRGSKHTIIYYKSTEHCVCNSTRIRLNVMDKGAFDLCSTIHVRSLPLPSGQISSTGHRASLGILICKSK